VCGYVSGRDCIRRTKDMMARSGQSFLRGMDGVLFFYPLRGTGVDHPSLWACLSFLFSLRSISFCIFPSIGHATGHIIGVHHSSLHILSFRSYLHELHEYTDQAFNGTYAVLGTTHSHGIGSVCGRAILSDTNDIST